MGSNCSVPDHAEAAVLFTFIVCAALRGLETVWCRREAGAWVPVFRGWWWGVLG